MSKHKLDRARHHNSSRTGQAARTLRNKTNQERARKKKAAKRIGQAALRRVERRAFLKKKRLDDPSYARKLPDADPEIAHQALNQDSRGIDQIIYSVTLRYKKH